MFVGGLQHHRGPLVAAGVAIGTLPVGPDCAFVQDRIPDAELETILQHRLLSAGVDDNFRPHLAVAAGRRAYWYADRTLALEQDLEHTCGLVHVDAVFAGIVEQHLVELAAHDLPGL